jgi:hypothetical protein
VCGDDADVAGRRLDKLHMSRRPPGEGEPLGGQAAQTPRVVGRFVGRQQVRGLGELVDAHAVLQHHHDAFLGQLDAPHGGQGADLERCLAFEVIPDDELAILVS